MRYLKPASPGRISFNIGPLCTSLISAFLSLARSRHNHALPFALGTTMKLLHHSDVSFTPKDTIICFFCNLSRSSYRGS